MNQPLSEAEATHFKDRLVERHAQLRAAIHAALLRSDNEHYQQIAGEVHDPEEQSVADLLVDVNLADIDRDVDELRDVEAALDRLHRGTYALCERCHQPISRQRLEAWPTARRCLPCQEHEEHLRVRSSPPPSL